MMVCVYYDYEYILHYLCMTACKRRRIASDDEDTDNVEKTADEEDSDDVAAPRASRGN